MNLLMFGPLSWDGPWYSRHHITRRLAERHRVIIAKPPVEWREAIRGVTPFARRISSLPEVGSLSAYTPPRWLPKVYRGGLLPTILDGLRTRHLKNYLRTNGVRDPILYVWTPEYLHAAKSMPNKRLVYHSYDKYDRYHGVDVEQVQESERYLVERADLCVAASTKLAAHLERLGARRILLLPHGVDTQLFRPGTDVPTELEAVPRPRLGLTARMNEVLDVATLRFVAESRPDWSIVLVGGKHFTSQSKERAFEALIGLPNVHHMGQRGRRTIPSWLNGFDVGMICYDRDEWAPYNQPIKLYEYLACGLPVVSTRINAVEELGDLVYACDSPEDWLNKTERALSDRSPEAAGRRIAFADSASWDQRVSQLDDALHSI